MEDSKRIFEIISRQTGSLTVLAQADSTELHSLPRALLSSDYLHLVRVSDCGVLGTSLRPGNRR